MAEHNTPESCPFSEFYIPTEEEFASEREHLRSHSPEMASIINRSEQARTKRYSPPEPTRREIAGEVAFAVLPRLALVAGGAFGFGWLLFGTQPHQSPVPAIVSNANSRGVDALIPNSGMNRSRSVTLMNGTRLMLNCVLESDNTRIDVTIENGNYAHQGGQHVLLAPGSSNNLDLNPKESIPTELC